MALQELEKQSDVIQGSREISTRGRLFFFYEKQKSLRFRDDLQWLFALKSYVVCFAAWSDLFQSYLLLRELSLLQSFFLFTVVTTAKPELFCYCTLSPFVVFQTHTHLLWHTQGSHPLYCSPHCANLCWHSGK